MNNKQYFTPAIDDIRIGYECEFLLKEFVNTTGPAIEAWVHATFNKYGLKLTDSERIIDYPNPYGSIQNGYIRVPYLTRKQLEKEGWEFNFGMGDHMHFSKDRNSIVLFERGHTIKIESPSNYKFYWGRCNDINTFRFLIKLLEA